MADNNEKLYESLGALIQSNKDIKEELRFIHHTIVEDKKDLKEFEKVIGEEFKETNKRVTNLEKKQYSIVVLATFVWSIIVMMIRKYL